MIRQKVLLAQSGDQSSMQGLIDQFTPLLKRYSRQLYIEDSFNELVLSFIEIVHAIPLDSLNSNNDGVIVKYIVTSLKNAYIAHIRKNARAISPILSWEEMTESQRNETIFLTSNNKTDEVNFNNLLASCPTLTSKEKKVLTLVYLYGYSSAEIADKVHSSRQNINQIKRRAVEKMRKTILLS